MPKKKNNVRGKGSIKQPGGKQPDKTKGEKNQPLSDKWFELLTTHPELEAFKSIQTAFWPHPKPQPIRIELLKEFENRGIFLSASHLLQLPHAGTVSGIPIDGTGTVIAILDTGVNGKGFEHDDLKGKVIKKINYKGDVAGDVDDLHGHGTHLAGIVAGNVRNSVIGGVAPGARIVSVKVTDKNSDSTSWWKITDGLQQVLNYNIKANEKDKVTAVLMTFNAFDNTNFGLCACHHRLCKLINTLFKQDVPVIVSAGNGFEYFNKEGLSYPAHTDKIIAGGATYNSKIGLRRTGDLTRFTQRIDMFNNNIENLFLLAPGKDTLSCDISSPTSYKRLSGSCQASAVIAGVVLLMQQKYLSIMRSTPKVKKLQDCLATYCDVYENVSDRISSPSYRKKFRHLNANRSIRNII